jgi:hypothetical protein
MSGVTAISMSTETPAATATPAAETPAVTRPDYIPEKFWKGNLEDSTKAMAASYGELERKQSGGRSEGTGSTADATPPATPATSTTTPTPEEAAASKAVESALTTAAGSADTLKSQLDWARANATPAQKALFDAALDSGNPELVKMAYEPIKAAYTAAMGTQGTRVVGESVPTTVGAKPFASQQEIIKFVNSPAYKSGDRAAHREYEERMKVTKW